MSTFPIWTPPISRHKAIASASYTFKFLIQGRDWDVSSADHFNTRQVRGKLSMSLMSMCSMIYHCTDPRQHGTSLFYIIVRKGTARSSDILKTLTTMFSFHNVRADRAESHAPNVKFILRFFYLHIYI